MYTSCCLASTATYRNPKALLLPVCPPGLAAVTLVVLTQFALGMLTHYKATTLRWEKGIFFLTPLTVHQASPISRLQTNTSYQIGSSIRLEIKCSVCVMSLNHPETNPCPLVCETNCLPRNVPGAKKG